MFLHAMQKLAMEHGEHFARWNGVTAMKDFVRDSTKTQICCITTYVRGVTAESAEGQSLSCQGLHNEVFLPYVS
jgi:hypothetical protein